MGKKFFIFLFFITLLITVNLMLPLPQVSYELQSDLLSADPAPEAATPEKRIWLWLHKYSPTIRSAAYKYHVDPVAIAGVIAWEGAKNNHIKRMSYGLMVNFIFTKGLFLKSIGPGKVQAWGPGNAATFIEGNPRYQPVFPVLPASIFPPLVERIIRLHNPVMSIEYIAGIMNAYATEAEKAGYTDNAVNLRAQPGMAATFFDGVRGYSLPQAGAAFQERMKVSGNVPFKLNEVGRWIEKNRHYLTSALAFSDRK